jgi:hypothetical protein
MKPIRYRPSLHPSRFERQARLVAITVAVILLGATAIEMALVTKRQASIHKLPPSATADSSQ